MTLTLDNITGIIGSVLGVAGLVVGIITLVVTKKRNPTRKQVYYKERARIKFKTLKDTLAAADMLVDIPFGGGANTIIPQLHTENVDKIRTLESPEVSGYKRTVRYIYEDSSQQRRDTLWGIK